jgi:hypothetical protein
MYVSEFRDIFRPLFNKATRRSVAHELVKALSARCISLRICQCLLLVDFGWLLLGFVLGRVMVTLRR